jgi:hypothetical protein
MAASPAAELCESVRRLAAKRVCKTTMSVNNLHLRSTANVPTGLAGASPPGLTGFTHLAVQPLHRSLALQG